MNRSLSINERHDLETHLNFKRELTGSLDSISSTISSGKLCSTIWNLMFLSIAAAK